MRVFLFALVLAIVPVIVWAFSQSGDPEVRRIPPAVARVSPQVKIVELPVDPVSEATFAPPEDIEEFEYVKTTGTAEFTVRQMGEHSNEIAVTIFGVHPPGIPDGGSSAYQQAADLADTLERGRVFLEPINRRSSRDQSAVKAWVWVKSGDGDFVYWDLLNLLYIARGRGSDTYNTPYRYSERMLNSKYATEVAEVISDGMDGYYELLGKRHVLCSLDVEGPDVDTGGSDFEFLNQLDIEVCYLPNEQNDTCVYQFAVHNDSGSDIHFIIEGEYVDGDVTEDIEFSDPTEFHLNAGAAEAYNMALNKSFVESMSAIKWGWDITMCTGG